MVLTNGFVTFLNSNITLVDVFLYATCFPLLNEGFDYVTFSYVTSFSVTWFIMNYTIHTMLAMINNMLMIMIIIIMK